MRKRDKEKGLKIGDIVTFRKNLKIGLVYGGLHFLPDMLPVLGGTFKVDYVWKSELYFKIKYKGLGILNNFWYSFDMVKSVIRNKRGVKWMEKTGECLNVI